MAYPSKKRGSSVPSFEDLVRLDLKTGNFRPVYLLSGEDVLRKEGVVEHLKKTVLGDAGCAFNYHPMAGDNLDLGKVLQQAVSYPMLGSHQIIWVRNIDVCLTDPESQKRTKRPSADLYEAICKSNALSSDMVRQHCPEVFDKILPPFDA